MSSGADDLHMLRSIYGNLEELKRLANLRRKRGEVSDLGIMVLADNMDWLDCYIDRQARKAD